MRIAVLSDIHGNLPALEAVLGDIQSQGVDAIAVAGDMTSGVWADAVVNRVLEVARWVVAGNHEAYYTDCDQGRAHPDWRTSRQWQAMRWSYDQLSRETLDRIAALPEQVVIAVDGAPPIRLVHGSPRSNREFLFPDGQPAALAHFRAAGLLGPDAPTPLTAALDGVPEPVVVCGHSHIPWIQPFDGRLALSDGATGGAIDGDVRAQYALLTWRGPDAGGWQAAHRQVAYDLSRVRAGFESSGYLKEGGAFAHAILRNVETGRNVPGDLLRHVRAYARAAGYEDTPVSDALWDAAVAAYDWGDA